MIFIICDFFYCPCEEKLPEGGFGAGHVYQSHHRSEFSEAQYVIYTPTLLPHVIMSKMDIIPSYMSM